MYLDLVSQVLVTPEQKEALENIEQELQEKLLQEGLLLKANISLTVKELSVKQKKKG